MRRAAALIAEDEKVLVDELRTHLALLWPELDIVGTAANGIEALALFAERHPRVLFLDIEMPGMTGLEVARQLQGRCHIVFVTAYQAYAVAAFEQGAVDYVLKPFDTARLARTVGRIKERLDAPPSSLDGLLSDLVGTLQRRDYLRWINAAERDAVKLIAVDDVVYFQSDHGYTRVVTQDGEALIQSSLKELQEQLDPGRFWPIHRSTIVNASAISGVTRDFRGRVSVKLKTRSEKLSVSEVHEHLFRRM